MLGSVVGVVIVLEGVEHDPGVLSIHAHAIGFTTLSLRMSSSAVLPGPARAEAAMARVVALLIAAGQRLMPLFGYFTRYEDQLDERWLANQVFIPLLTEEREPALPSRVKRGEPLAPKAPGARCSCEARRTIHSMFKF